MQLSVYFGQQIILSSWPQEVPIGWHANEACLFSPLLILLLHCYDLHYMLSPSLLIVFIIYSLHNAHSTCIMSSSVYPTSCYDFLMLSNSARSFFSLPFRINTSIPAVLLRNHFRPADTSSLTHRFMFSFMFFFFHICIPWFVPLSIDSGSVTVDPSRYCLDIHGV